MKASISGILACISGAALAYSTLRLGHSFVYAQIADPALGRVLRPVLAGGAALLTFVVAIVALMIILAVLDSFESQGLFGRHTFTLVGGAGLLGSAAGLVQTIHKILSSAGVESVAALLLVSPPIIYAFYHLWQPPKEPIQAGARRNNETLDPEYVRERTVYRSDDYKNIRRWDPAKNKEGRDEQQDCLSRQDDSSRSNQQIDYADLEFNWTTDTNVSFDDVGGMNTLKNELDRDIIKPLTTDRVAAAKLGISAPNVILHGPPGTGKTYITRALATELDLPFVQLSGADLLSKWINESASNVKTLFDEATTIAAKEGGAVIFVDELDSVLKSRTNDGNNHEEDNKVVNEFLNRLEDIGDHDIVFIGATNRLDSLDSAGIRSGRIDKKIQVGRPDKEARKSILEAQLNDRPHSLTERDIAKIAGQTDGLTAADLTRLVEEAARESLFERGDDQIISRDLLQALVE